MILKENSRQPGVLPLSGESTYRDEALNDERKTKPEAQIYLLRFSF